MVVSFLFPIFVLMNETYLNKEEKQKQGIRVQSVTNTQKIDFNEWAKNWHYQIRKQYEK